MRRIETLSPPQEALVREIVLRRSDPDRNRPVVFGSRATGSAKTYSDVDIGIAGEPLPLSELGLIREDFDNSSLPFVVDVVNFADMSAEFAAVAGKTTIEIR